MGWGDEGVLNTVLVTTAHDPRAGQLSRYSVGPKSHMALRTDSGSIPQCSKGAFDQKKTKQNKKKQGREQRREKNIRFYCRPATAMAPQPRSHSTPPLPPQPPYPPTPEPPPPPPPPPPHAIHSAFQTLRPTDLPLRKIQLCFFPVYSSATHL